MLPAPSPQKTASPVVRVDGLTCGYPGREVLSSISFEVDRGELLGILGPNGAGKSTLVLALSGIIHPSAGRIEIMGAEISRIGLRDRARRLGVITQDAEVRFPFSCREVVEMGRYPHQGRWRLDSPGDSEAVEAALKATDTEGLAERLITAVSGGEKQRVFVAKSLAQETQVLLLDEATSAMDINRKIRIFKVIEQLNRERELTVLAVMHDINLAALFCRRLLLLKDGMIAADGPTDEVLTPGVLESVYDTRVLVHHVEGAGKKQVVFLP